MIYITKVECSHHGINFALLVVTSKSARHYQVTQIRCKSKHTSVDRRLLTSSRSADSGLPCAC